MFYAGLYVGKGSVGSNEDGLYNNKASEPAIPEFVHEIDIINNKRYFEFDRSASSTKPDAHFIMNYVLMTDAEGKFRLDWDGSGSTVSSYDKRTIYSRDDYLNNQNQMNDFFNQ